MQIDAIAPEAAMRVMTGVGGAIKGRDKLSDTPLRVDTVYDESRARLKIIVTGSLATTVGLLRLLEVYAELRADQPVVTMILPTCWFDSR